MLKLKVRCCSHPATSPAFGSHCPAAAPVASLLPSLLLAICSIRTSSNCSGGLQSTRPSYLDFTSSGSTEQPYPALSTVLMMQSRRHWCPQQPLVPQCWGGVGNQGAEETCGEEHRASCLWLQSPFLAPLCGGRHSHFLLLCLTPAFLPFVPFCCLATAML